MTKKVNIMKYTGNRGISCETAAILGCGVQSGTYTSGDERQQIHELLRKWALVAM